MCTKTGFSKKFYLSHLLLISALFLSSPLLAADPTNISFTLEGCRNNGTIMLPNGSGQFICPDSAYTTGNLGKGWNELDLVPFRLTVDAGKSAPATQTYSLSIILDYIDVGHPGYDVISAPVLNTAKSDASCAPLTSGSQTILNPGFGGIDESIYRLITITQSKETTCVYDYYGRLALGSHLFPGSSLHANLANANQGSAGIGSKDVSIPVKEIAPQEVSKNMSARQALDYIWNVTKTGLPASINFGDVCLAGAPQPKTVNITVSWAQLPASPGTITAVANIYATNPATRTIDVSVIDAIYQGSTQVVLLDQDSFGPVPVPANTTALVATHTVSLPSSVGNINDYLNDIATATYIDQVTGIPVPGQTTAMAQAQIQQGNITNSTAGVRDSESITGDGLSFAVAPPAVGSYTNYTADTSTVGPVNWSSGAQTASGSVVFNKTVSLDGKRITAGILTDTANLKGSDGFSSTSGAFNVDVSSSASVKLTIEKSIPVLAGFGANEKFVITFRITRANDPSYQKDVDFEFVGGGATTLTTDETGLVQDTYTVTEQACVFYDANNVPHTPCGLVSNPNQKSVDLRVYVDENDNIIANCLGKATFVNEIQQSSFAKAQVQKVTDPIISSGDPDYNWSYTLTGPTGSSAIANANAGFVDFGVQLQEGNYTVTETLKPNWILDNAVPNNGVIQTVCSFSVNYPDDFGKTFQCTFHNTKKGNAQVVKTVSGGALTGSQAFTFQLRQGASTTMNGNTLESLIANVGNGGTITFATALTPGTTYQLCEIIMPGWATTLGTFVPNSFSPPDGVAPNPDVDNSILCGNFTVSAGQTKVFNIDNTPPAGGRALTIGFWKNWSSCSPSKGKQAFILDQTLASFPIAYGQTTHGVFLGKLYVNNCTKAYRILNKSDVVSGAKMASDPLYNMAAQLLAVRLNLQAGAYSCPAVLNAITQANNLLKKYNFTGTGKYTSKMTAADKKLANNLATFFDNYNNNRPGVCP